MQGLALIQGLVLGDALEFEKELMLQLRVALAHIIAQISDLRSVLSKEGSRTVAIISVRLGAVFGPLVDQTVTALLKLTTIKTKTISNAADRAIRVVLATVNSGYPRLLVSIAENINSKSPLLRKVAFEYVSR